MQRSRGCPELGAEHPGIFYELDGEVVRHCLVARVSEQSLAWIQECNYLEVGLLPEPGGLNDQWEIDLRAFAIIQSERAAIRSKGEKGKRVKG